MAKYKRAKSKTRKNNRIEFRVSDEELDILNKLSDRWTLNKTDCVRVLLKLAFRLIDYSDNPPVSVSLYKFQHDIPVEDTEIPDIPNIGTYERRFMQDFQPVHGEIKILNKGEEKMGKRDGKEFEELKMDLLTSKYTKVFAETDFQYNAPHTFMVIDAAADADEDPEVRSQALIQEIHFQEGPIKECGVNGVNNEDLINMVLCRLQHFQESEYKCRENACAITKLEEALMWLRKRTNARAARGVEGTSKV